MNVDRDRLTQQLIIHEGLRLFPYTDSVGKLSIGIGRNLTDNGISRAEALMLFDHDLDERAVGELDRHAPWAWELDPVRQAVLIDLCFNMGWPSLSEFRNTLAAIRRRDWVAAAEGLRASKWHRQIQPSRSKRLRTMLVTGQWPNELNA